MEFIIDLSMLDETCISFVQTRLEKLRERANLKRKCLSDDSFQLFLKEEIQRCNTDMNKMIDEAINSGEWKSDSEMMNVSMVFVLSQEYKRMLKTEYVIKGIKCKKVGTMALQEKKYFNKAIEVGFMKQKENGYEWLYNKGQKVSLAYFLQKVFDPKGTAQIPFKHLEALFGVTRLDSALDGALSAKKPQKWRGNIDMLFDD